MYTYHLFIVLLIYVFKNLLYFLEENYELFREILTNQVSFCKLKLVWVRIPEYPDFRRVRYSTIFLQVLQNYIISYI